MGSLRFVLYNAEDIMSEVQVGIGVLILRRLTTTPYKLQILLGLRTGSHGAGEWGAPGGKPNLWESPVQAGVREVKEETGLTIYDESLKFVLHTDNRFPEFGRHFITLYYYAPTHEGTVKLMEPNKCIKWGWFDLDELPHNIMQGTVDAIRLLEANLNGRKNTTTAA
jgi:8-oxo-dGTP diphosphatase